MEKFDRTFLLDSKPTGLHHNLLNTLTKEISKTKTNFLDNQTWIVTKSIKKKLESNSLPTIYNLENVECLNEQKLNSNYIKIM